MARLKSVRTRSGKVYVCGILPSITFGHEVVSISPSGLRALRAECAWALGRTCRGAILDVSWASDPKSDPAVSQGTHGVPQAS